MKQLNPNERGGRLLTAGEVAEYLNCTPRYVLLLGERGTLPAIRLGRKAVRFDPADVDALVAGSKRAVH